MFWAITEAEGDVGILFNRFKPLPPVIYYWPFQGGASVVVHFI